MIKNIKNIKFWAFLILPLAAVIIGVYFTVQEIGRKDSPEVFSQDETRKAIRKNFPSPSTNAQNAQNTQIPQADQQAIPQENQANQASESSSGHLNEATVSSPSSLEAASPEVGAENPSATVEDPATVKKEKTVK